MRQRFKTAHLLIGALLVWLVVSVNLRHLSFGFDGEVQAEPSTWERVIRMLSDSWT